MGPVTYRAGCTSQDSLVLCLRTIQTQSVAVYLLDTHSVILHDYIHTALYGNMPSALQMTTLSRTKKKSPYCGYRETYEESIVKSFVFIAIKKQRVEYYSAFKRNEILLDTTTWMKLANVLLNKPDTKGQILYGSS